MLRIVEADPTFHELRSELNDSAPENVSSKVKTFETSQSRKSPTNDSVLANIFDISTTER